MKDIVLLTSFLILFNNAYCQEEKSTIQSISQIKIKIVPFGGIAYEHALGHKITLNSTANYWSWPLIYQEGKSKGYSFTSGLRWYPKERMKKLHIGGYLKYSENMVTNKEELFPYGLTYNQEQINNELTYGFLTGWQWNDKSKRLAFDVYIGIGFGLWQHVETDGVVQSKMYHESDHRLGFTLGYLIK